MAETVTAAKATARMVRIAPRKARLVVDTIRGKSAAEASQEKVGELIDILEKLDSKASLDPETPMDSLGLTNPNQVINLETGNGAVYSVSIGSETPTGSGYYAQLNGGTPQIISTYAGASLARFSDPVFISAETSEP